MKTYETPEMKLVLLTAEDIIATSYGQVGGIEGTAPDSDDSEFGG